MDSIIRDLLSVAADKKDERALKEAYEKLERGRQTSYDQPDPFGSELYVLCAETAIQVLLHCQFLQHSLYLYKWQSGSI